MREVTLEILRHGPPNNQLLSPLTRYLALCGNHQAVTLELPYEHSQFLIRLRGLRYRDSSRTREMQLTETGKELGTILAKIPGLIREMGDCANTPRLEPGAENMDASEPLTHLRLILSANELALLPFELAQSPNGFPGAGQPLALQTDTPICITREVRRVREGSVPLDRRPKILFLAASPTGMAEVPMRAHLLALRKAIAPWLGPYNPEVPEDVKREVGRHLTVLLSADVESIERACSEGEFTHVHILAHGVPHTRGASRGFGLALHDPRRRDRVDVVEGNRLTTLLRPRVRADQGLACPLTVTIASCDSAGVGSVVGAAASVAHSLHEGGIPLVVAAQFPLSFAGSVIIAQTLYEGLLWGEDPRSLFDRLRRTLLARTPTTHDWASLVAYASFPGDLERQLSKARIRQAERSIDAALKYAGSAIVEMSDDRWWSKTRSSTGTGTPLPGFQAKKGDPAAALDLLELPLKKIRQAKRRLLEVVDNERESLQRVWIWGRLASTEKQEAEIRLRAAQHFGTGDDLGSREAARASLDRAQRYYRDAFDADPSQSWGLVQAFVLNCVLDDQEWDEEEWTLARLVAKRETKSADRMRRTWGFAALLELHLLRWLVRAGERDRRDDRTKALEFTDRFLELTERDSFDLFSTRRQIVRYYEFFPQIAKWRDRKLVVDIVKKLPEPTAPTAQS